MAHGWVAAWVLLCLIMSCPSAAAIDFVRDVRPIFQRHCYSCHGADKQKSGLRLDLKPAAFRGGDSFGPNIIPGKAQQSSLIQFVRGDDADMRMPPESPPLTLAEIETLTQWIDGGAGWPDGVDLVQDVDKREQWSFKPIHVTPLPATQNQRWPRNGIDFFILSRLEQAGISPAPEAGRVTLLRRLSFDLLGLPPLPEQVDAFVNDPRSDSLEKVVDEMLGSVRHGERWAQHWLDVVRYADTHGFEVNTPRQNAWPYRDYVIQSFNEDTPYDRFIQEQLAGDGLGKDAATGFLVTAAVLLPGQIGADDASKRLARQDALGEIIINTSEAFLGLSVGCARCHDHKFDPISHHDYYAFQAFFSGVQYEDRPIRSPEADSLRQEAESLKVKVAEIDQALLRFEPLAQTGAERASVTPVLNIDRFQPVTTQRIRFTVLETNNLEPCLDELEVFSTAGRNVALATQGTQASSSGDLVAAGRHELKHIHDGRYGNSRSWISSEKGKGWVELAFARPETIERVVWARDREGKFRDRLAVQYQIEVTDTSGNWRVVADSKDRRKPEVGDKKPPPLSTAGLRPEEANEVARLLKEKKSAEVKIAAATEAQMVFAGKFTKAEPTHLLHRGDPEQPRAEVVPAVLSALGDQKLSKEALEQERRQLLAAWIASPANPLTARVMVNRIWQWHFGIGLVETASDFGRNGTRPSHPELLDWLASEFIRSGWSIRHMHRLILTSATYRQSNRVDRSAQAKDADNRLLWRFPARRLEAETIRDSMLAVSGRLNLKMGGRGFDLFASRGGLSGFPPIESFSGDGLRRMIYSHKIRMEREAVFGAFDCPDAGQSTARRRQSTTPIQALNLFNSRFTFDEADAFAARVKAEIGSNTTQQVATRLDVSKQDVATQIEGAYRIAFGRHPEPVEIADAEPIVREFGLATLCRALFNSNEFLFLP